MPLLPVAVPGAAVSPGRRTCNWLGAPAFTVIAGLVLAVFVGSGTSDAVRVRLPTVLSVTLSVRVPLTSAVSAGRAALGSVLVR